MRNQVLGNRYRIQERIGEGGMAFVYVAVDEKLGRRVAIKVLHEHMEKNQDIRKRFQMEAQAISCLDHPNIVKIYDYSGEGLGRLWIVTEVIKGQNLAQYVQQFTGGWLHPIIAACVVREILKALYTAHAHGIVHRDVKPENVMMTVEGQVKLMDFGIAKDLGKSSMTLTGTFMGSPSYMSPEQIRGRDVDLRSDLYSLSVLFYEIVTGRLPFTGQTTHDVVLKIMEGEFTYPRFLVPSLPDQMDAIIVRGMGKDPAHRFQTANDYAAALDAFLTSMGFDESHIELERYFRDPAAYEERLTRTKFADSTAAIEARKTRPLTQQMTGAGRAQQPSPAAAHRISASGSARNSQVGRAATQRLPTQKAPAPSPTAQKKPTQPPAQKPLTQKEPPQRPLTQGPVPRSAAATTRGTPAMAATETPAPPPLRRADAWQGHQPQAQPAPQALPVAQPASYREPQHPAAPAQPRAPTQHREPQHRGTRGGRTQVLSPVAYVNQAPAVDAGTGRRQAGYPMQRQARPLRSPSVRVNRIPRFTIISQSWTNYVFGVALVGLIGIVSIWGFVELSTRLASASHSRGARVVNAPGKGGKANTVHPDKTEVKHATGIRNGTPVVVKQITKKTGATVIAQAPIAAKPPKKAEKKKSVKLTKWTVQTTVVPSPGPADPNLAVETVEVRKTRKTDDGSAAEAPAPAPAPAPPPAPAPAPEPVVAEKPDDTKKPDADPQPAPIKQGKGRVTVSSDPAAEVFVDGRRVGTTVDNTMSSGWIELKSGKHRLELKRQGYAVYRTAFEVQPDEQRAIPRINLESGGSSATGSGSGAGAAAGSKGTALTLRVSAFPAQVTIRNLDNNTTQAFTLKSPSRLVQLESGRYQVKVERKGEAKERELNLTGAQGQLTFTADFKGE